MTITTDFVRVNALLNGTVPSNAQATAASTATINTLWTDLYGNSTAANTQAALNIVGRLGLTGELADIAQVFIATTLNATAYAQRGEALAIMAGYLVSTPSGNAYKATADAFVTQSNAAIASAQTPGYSGGVFTMPAVLPSTPGSSFTLTNAVGGRVVNLTAGDDTVNATTNANTLNTATVIDSSVTDRDVLNARITTSATPTLITNVETINVDVAGFGVVLDVANVRYGTTGGSEIVLSNSQVGNTAVSVTNVGANNVNFKVAPSITTLNLTGTANANDSTKITVQGNLSVAHTAGTGVETVTFAGDGGAHRVTLTAGTGGEAREYIVAGSNDLTLRGTTDHFHQRQVREAEGFQGATRLEISSGTTSGNLTNVQLDTISLIGAMGANTITFRNDAIVHVNAAGATSGATFDVGMGTSTGGVANTGTANTLNLVNVHASGMGSGHTLTTAAAVDVLNITLNQPMGSGTGSGSAFTITHAGNAGTTAADAVSTINLLGSAAVNLVVGSSGTGTGGDNLVINAVGLNAPLHLVASGAAGFAGGFTILGSNVSSLITANGSGLNTIIGGSGNDTITGSAQADSINAGAGNDVITLGAGADTIFGGAGADQFRIGSGSGSGSGARIDDFVKGEDRLVLQGNGDILNLSSVLVTNGLLSGSTSFGNVTLRNGGSLLQNTTSGTGDDWTDSIQLGRATGATYNIAAGSGDAAAVTASNFNDFISLANADDGSRSINLGAGNDFLNITAASGDTGSLIVRGGAGNDTINLNATTASAGAGVVTLRFESSAALNGLDTINGFAASATGTPTAGVSDVLDFRAFLGNIGGDSTRVYLGTSGGGGVPVLATADGLGSTGLGPIDFTAASGAGTASSGGVAGHAGNEAFVIYDGTAILTSARFVSGTAAAAGQIAIADGTSSVVIQALGGTTSTVANVYFVENGAVAGLDDLVITQVGVINFLAGEGTNGFVRETFA